MSATLATAASGRELIPGDPDEVEALAARLAALGEGLSEAAARLVDLDDGGWRGPAAEAFRANLGDQPERYAVAGEAFATATAALRRYAGVVSDAQAEGDRAIDWWQEGEAATGAWERAWSSHDAEVAQRRASTELAIVAGAGDLLRPSLVDPGAEWRQRAISTLDAATAAVDHEAAATAAALAAAEEGAPDEPGFWSRLWAGLSGFADGLWASTGGAVVEIVEAALDDLGGFVSDAWDNAVDHPTSSTGAPSPTPGTTPSTTSTSSTGAPSPTPGPRRARTSSPGTTGRRATPPGRWGASPATFCWAWAPARSSPACSAGGGELLTGSRTS